jgi:photosystem II core protein PsbZ
MVPMHVESCVHAHLHLHSRNELGRPRDQSNHVALWPHARTISTQKRLCRPAAVRFDETQRAWSDSTTPLAAQQHSCHSVRRRPERAERTARNTGRIVSNVTGSVTGAPPDSWSNNKNVVFSGISLWIGLVFLVAILNSLIS